MWYNFYFFVLAFIKLSIILPNYYKVNEINSKSSNGEEKNIHTGN